MLFGRKRDEYKSDVASQKESISKEFTEAEKIGRIISDCRKKKNFTQNELAEKLGISYQAVSSWERGMTLPDILNFKRLSSVLEVSADVLMGTKDSEAIITDEIIITDNPYDETYAENHSREADEKKKDFMGAKGTDADRDLGKLISAAPFLSSEKISEELKSIIESSEEINEALLTGLAPFVSSKKLSEIVDLIVRKKGTEGLSEVVVALAPFLNQKTLLSIINDHSFSFPEISSLLPFLSSDTLYKKVCEMINSGEEITPDKLISIAPFLNKENNGKILELLMDKMSTSEIMELTEAILPFIPEKTIDWYIRN